MYLKRLMMLVAGIVIAESIHATPKFMTLPFRQDNVTLQQGWEYDFGENRTHRGIDYQRSWQAFNVCASHDGQATYFSGCSDNESSCNGGLGNYVRIHKTIDGVDYYTLYCHLQSSPLSPSTPTTVVQGEIIGVAGKTGAANDVIHLHYEYHEGSIGNKKDPYDIYSVAANYPPNGGDCGTNYAWTACPPTMYTYSCSYVSRSISPSGPYVPGQTITCQIKFHNTGTATWSKTGGQNNYVELGSCNSGKTIGYSYFDYNPSTSTCYPDNVIDWNSCYAPATFTEANVAPSNDATFNFTGKIRDDASPGTQNVYFGPVWDGSIMQGWSSTNGYFSVTVANADPSGSDFTALTGRFDNDGLTDVALYEASAGKWYVAANQGNSFGQINGTYTEYAWLDDWGAGSGEYIPLTGDFTGDGLTDICVYQPQYGRWFVARNDGDHFTPLNGPYTVSSWLTDWGTGSGFVPLVGDFNNDGKADVAVYRPQYGRWYVAFNNYGTANSFTQSTGTYTEQSWYTDWGTGSGFVPLVGDYNGDGKTDIGLYEAANGRWYIAFNDYGTANRFSQANGTYTYQSWYTGWGGSGCSPLVGDFNDDGKSDIAYYQSQYGRWYVAYNDYGTYNRFDVASGTATNGSWLTDWGTGSGLTPLVGNFSSGPHDIGLYDPSLGRWFVAFNNFGTAQSFSQSNGPYPSYAWYDDWGKETGTPKIAVGGHDETLPLSFNLSQNYPNPFNPVTTISYTLPAATHVSLDIFNILGQKVATLVNAKQEAGEHSALWNCEHCSSGIYLYRISTDQAVETKKMLLLK